MFLLGLITERAILRPRDSVVLLQRVANPVSMVSAASRRGNAFDASVAIKQKALRPVSSGRLEALPAT